MLNLIRRHHRKSRIRLVCCQLKFYFSQPAQPEQRPQMIRAATLGAKLSKSKQNEINKIENFLKQFLHCKTKCPFDTLRAKVLHCWCLIIISTTTRTSLCLFCWLWSSFSLPGWQESYGECNWKRGIYQIDVIMSTLYIYLKSYILLTVVF